MSNPVPTGEEDRVLAACTGIALLARLVERASASLAADGDVELMLAARDGRLLLGELADRLAGEVRELAAYCEAAGITNDLDGALLTWVRRVTDEQPKEGNGHGND